MPDTQGYLSQPERQLIQKYLESKGAFGACPSCGHSSWDLANQLLNLIVYVPTGMTLGGPTYPQLVLVCTNCAYSRNHMAALVPGLIDGGAQ